MCDYYITQEEYEKAKANGISQRNLEQRIRWYGWSKKRAINTPVKKRETIPREFRELAEANGISKSTFYNRVCTQKWDMHKAATEPVVSDKEKGVLLAEKNRKYPKEYIEKAKDNGINEHNFRRRVREYGWGFEKAATTPIMTKEEVGQASKNKSRKLKCM